MINHETSEQITVEPIKNLDEEAVQELLILYRFAVADERE